MTPALSVVVVGYDMARELPRTLRSLAPGYQREIDADDYEVIVVDNGSPEPIAPDVVDGFGGHVRTICIDPAPPSPAMAANRGLAEATGHFVGLVLDGARMASPRLLARAGLAARLTDRPVIATLGWHLGPASHMDAATTGWDQAAEDALLAEIGWEDDGYRLFEASVLAGSSQRGWFGPMGESHALFLPRSLWNELGGLDERFALPGGGLVNHDLYRRACSLSDTQLVVLLGEGTFHQFHGGAATSRRFGRDEMFADYEKIRGQCYEPPDNRALYLGTVPPEAMAHLESSLAWARRSATSAQA
jgi:glycosyltransferase involved in cell wall biosynthesis